MIDNTNKPRFTHLDENKVLHVPFHKYEERHETCKQCYAYDKETGHCKINTAPVSVMIKFKSSNCPLGFWSSYYGD
jgi:hypothetical protein